MNTTNNTYTSPWIYELQRSRESVTISDNATCDTTIIGGGISGVLTAESLLSSTDQTVILLEASRIAHGATGHNAGQLTTYFERPISSIVDEFGPIATRNTMQAIERGHTLLLDIRARYNLETPLYFFTGYTGIQSVSQMQYFIEQQNTRIAIGLPAWDMFALPEFLESAGIAPAHHPYITIATAEHITELLVTNSDAYGAVIAEQKGCANSARFTEELASALLQQYPNRFTIYEYSPVQSVHFSDSVTITSGETYTVTTDSIILCTNGFENFRITSDQVPTLDTEFHTSIEGLVGYMGAYTDHPSDNPTAISYLTNPTDPEDYHYLTRRPFAKHENNTTYNLISVGGPVETIDEVVRYDAFTEIDQSITDTIGTFLRQNYAPAQKSEFEFSFLWHGLMGYTKNKVRMVGRDTREHRLIYNIGCNGVGILPATISAPRIACMMSGIPVPPYIFDIKNTNQHNSNESVS